MTLFSFKLENCFSEYNGPNSVIPTFEKFNNSVWFWGFILGTVPIPLAFCFEAASGWYFLEDPQTSVSLCMRKNEESECMYASLLSCIWLFANPWTTAYQAPLFMGFFRWEYWSGGDLPDPGIKLTSPMSPAIIAGGILYPQSYPGAKESETMKEKEKGTIQC